MTATTFAALPIPRTGLQTGCVVMDVYCRISQDYDGTTRSVDDQEEDALDVLADHPEWVLGMVHKDHAKSAWNPRVKRASWDVLMDRLESGAAGGVLVYDLTRFTRKPIEGERLLALASRGVVVASITTTYNLQTADGRKQFRDAMTAAAFESDKISERTSRGKRKRARRGKPNNSWRGFARPGYLPNPEGWEPGDPRTPVDPVQLGREVTAVQEAAVRLLAGETLGVIATEWNAQGLLTTTGGRWNGARLRQTLSQSTMAGLITDQYGDVWGETAEGYAPLDRDTWERLMLHFSSRRRGHPGTIYLLSGFLRCGRCGSRLYGRPLVAQSPYPDGEVRRQYWCMYRPADKQHQGCGKVTIDQRYADAIVERMVLDRLADPRHADRVAKVAARLAEALAKVRLELADLNAEADAVADKTGEPGWNVARVDKALAKYAPRIADAEARLAALVEQQGDTPRDARTDAVTDWKSASLLQRRTLVRRALPDLLYVMPATSRGAASLRSDRFVPGPQWEAMDHTEPDGVRLECEHCEYRTGAYPTERKAMHPLLGHMRRKHPDAPRRGKRD